MCAHDLPSLVTTSLALSLLASCSGGGGDDDPVNEGSYTIAEFGYEPASNARQPLRGQVTAILAHKEVAALDPSGAYGTVGDFDTGTPSPGTAWTHCDGFAFEHAVGGQFDADPAEDFLALQYAAGTGRVRTASLEADGTWLERFQIPVGATAPRAAAAGDLDGDGATELVVVWDDVQGLQITVVDDGAVALTFPVLENYADLDLPRLELELCDADADGRDEIVLLGNRGPYWQAPWTQRRLPVLEVRDDLQAACMVIAQQEVVIFGDSSLHEGSPAHLITGDFDRYHEGEEISVTRLVFPELMLANSINFQFESFALVGEQSELRRWRRGEEDNAPPHLILMVAANIGAPVTQPPTASLTNFDVIAADLDGDGSEELVTSWFSPGGGNPSCPSSNGKFLVFNLPLDLTTAEIQERWAAASPVAANVAPEFPGIWDFSANFQRVGSYVVLGPEHRRISGSPTSCGGWPDLRATEWSFAAGDTDADARDEVHVTGCDGGLHPILPNFWCAIEATEQNGVFSLTESWWGRHAENLAPQCLVMTDWDGDDLRVRYTGNMQVALGDPMPLVVVAAPPTKEGAAQNRNGSQTIFDHGSGSSKVYSVSTGATVGVWAGYEVSDPLGLFGGASGRVKLDVEIERTVSEMSGQTFTQGFQTSHEDDVIVFHGTLYESYEYEVVSAVDPAVIGSHLTIDIPVDSRVYKWTLDYYNDTVDPQHVLNPFAHTVGDPASYMTEEEAGQLVAGNAQQVPGEGYVGWLSPKQNVGEGNGLNTVTIDLLEQWTTSTRLGWSVTAEQEVKVGSFVGGFSVGIHQDYVWDVSVSETTRYRGEVGDIAQSDWSQWQYGFGLVAYTQGLWSNSANEPSGTQPGVVPYQIETYFTDPRGWGYAGN